MGKYLLLLSLLAFNAQAFEPICSNPENFSKKDIANIFTGKNSAEKNQLIIYSVNPPTPIDWSTPGKAFKSLFKNSFINDGYTTQEYDVDRGHYTVKHSIKTHFIGHMFIQLSCAGYPTVLTGMSSPGYEEIKGLMLDGKSFSQIISTTKGHFNTAKELEQEINIRREKAGNLQYMGLNLRPGSCEELLKYLTEFKACGVNKRYGGLDANPHKGEGAGCSAFAMSFLQRLNILPIIDKTEPGQFGSQFLRTINIPKIMLKTKESDPEIGAWGLLKGNKIAWQTDGRPTTFFDPELFSKWVSEFNPSEDTPGLTYQGRENTKLVKGVWFSEKSNDIEPSSFALDFLNN